MLKLPELGALGERIDHQDTAGDEPGIELLLAVIIRTDCGGEFPRPYVFDTEEVGAAGVQVAQMSVVATAVARSGA